MPSGLRRYHDTGHSHFVTFSCYRRAQFLANSRACNVLLHAIEKMRMKFDMQIYGFVFMPEHVHLLLSEPQRGNLAEALHHLKLSTSKSLRSGAMRPEVRSFWQARYYDLNIRNHRQFQEKLRYIHRNPVKRGLCAFPGDWKWSSFRHYALREKLAVQIESEWTARDREDLRLGRAVGWRTFFSPSGSYEV
jgi:putative transposase